MAQGSLETIMEGLNRAKRDLGDVMYRNIDQKYRKQLVELKTTELAVQDLDKYFKVGENKACTRVKEYREKGAILNTSSYGGAAVPFIGPCSNQYGRMMT